MIRESCGLVDFKTLPMRRAASWLASSQPEPDCERIVTGADRITGSGAAAVRHVAADRRHGRGDVSAARGITDLHGIGACASIRAATIVPTRRPTETWPAMIAAVTDLEATSQACIALARSVRARKAPIDTPRRAMGDLLGTRSASVWQAT